MSAPDFIMDYKLDVYDVIALTLDSNNNELHNRTTLQKLIYFETLKIEPLKTITYQNHFYGPFSYQVAAALDEMVAFSRINEQTSSTYNHESYHYMLTKPGKKYASDVKDKFSKQFNVISDIVKICDKHCNLQANPLSYAAKAHYILVNGGKDQYTIDDVRETAKKFEWNISEKDAKNGINLLEKLELVRRT